MKQIAGRPQMRKDWELERVFREEGPFFHLHTKPLETGVIFENDIDRAVALVYIAVAAKTVGVEILAYALMSNHFHFILRGSEELCRAFFDLVRKRLSLYFSRHGRPKVLKAIGNPDPTPITTLKQLQDEIAYVIRNPYVVRVDVNPLAWLWCSGFLYFNPMLDLIRTRPTAQLTLSEKRESLRSRDVDIPDGLTWVDGCVFPGSFVNYRLAESMFRDARQFTFTVFKNVEAQVETALRVGDTPMVNDDEMLSVSLRLCRNDYGVKGPSHLSKEQKIDLAKKLKFDYYASNGQIARFTTLPLDSVNSLYPLSAKDSSSK
jgi:hypothetical protein